jgi:hypothetical protein
MPAFAIDLKTMERPSGDGALPASSRQNARLLPRTVLQILLDITTRDTRLGGVLCKDEHAA